MRSIRSTVPALIAVSVLTLAACGGGSDGGDGGSDGGSDGGGGGGGD